MPDTSFTIALISETFHDNDPDRRLREHLKAARDRGAELAVLPELPLNPWSPATKSPRADDAEKPNGPRAQAQAGAARETGIGLVGGVLLIDPADGVRRNTAHVWDARGELLGTYAKCHLPEEPGFWETSHYEPGRIAPPVFEGFRMPIGVQICSDINRPQGCHILAARGAQVILAPRATEQRTIERWKLVFRANALTTSTFICSVNRPREEQGVLIGGPSVAVSPDGRIILESTDAISVVTLHGRDIEKAKVDYPGYLPVRSDLYAQAWTELAATGPA